MNLRLYRIIEGVTEYWQTWTEGTTAIVHTGRVGQPGETRRYLMSDKQQGDAMLLGFDFLGHADDHELAESSGVRGRSHFILRGDVTGSAQIVQKWLAWMDFPSTSRMALT